MGIIDRFQSKGVGLVVALHGLVFAFIATLVAVLALKQQNPFKTHSSITEVFLVDVIIYIANIVLSIVLEGFAQEVTMYASLLSGFLAALLLFLIMVPVLGWVFLALWGVIVFSLIAYKLLSCWHPELPQQNIAIQEEENDEQPEDNTGRPATKWITVFSRPCPGTVQRCRCNVRGASLSPKIAKGEKDGLFISCVASCSNLWALIMNDATGFSDQVYKLSPNFLPHEWIEEQWNKDFHISAIAGADNGSSLVVMSKGTKFLGQQFVVSDSFPYHWIINHRKNGYYVTAMATSGKRWAIVASKGAGFSKQVVEVHSKYPSEHVRGWWDSGYNITATAANADQVALVLSVPRTTKATYNKQETYRSSAFPERHVYEYWDKDFYVSSICYGRTFSPSVRRQAMVC